MRIRSRRPDRVVRAARAQRLGRAMPLAEAPQAVIDHVARTAGIAAAVLVPETYDHSGTQQRHLAAIREYLQVRPYGPLAQVATNKSESFNAFVKWLAFGGGDVIAENDRGEQRKLIKYDHLLANCLIFHNVCMMTRALHKLRAEGVTVEPAAVAALSPYLRSHITRFGQYNPTERGIRCAIAFSVSTTPVARPEQPASE